ILGRIAIEALADLDLIVLCRQIVQQRLRVAMCGVNDSHHLEKLMERDSNRRRLDRVRNHLSYLVRSGHPQGSGAAAPNSRCSRSSAWELNSIGAPCVAPVRFSAGWCGFSQSPAAAFYGTFDL